MSKFKISTNGTYCWNTLTLTCSSCAREREAHPKSIYGSAPVGNTPMPTCAVVLLPLHGSEFAARLQRRFELIGCATLHCERVAQYLPSGVPLEGKCLATAWEVSSPAVLDAMKLLIGNEDAVAGSVQGAFGSSAAVGPITDGDLSAAILAPHTQLHDRS